MRRLISNKFNAINIPQIDIFTLIRLWGLKVEMFLVETEKGILKFRWNLKRLWTVKTSKDNKVGLTLSNFKTYSKTIIIKTMCSWNKDRSIDQQNKTAQK